MGRRSWLVRNIVEIFLHWQAGRSIQGIASSLGYDRKTVRKYIQAAAAAGMNASMTLSASEWADFVRRQFPEIVDTRGRSNWYATLDSHREFIRDGLQTNCVTTVWQRLRSHQDSTVSLSTFRRYIRATMPELRDPKQVTIWRPEVPPGEEAQLDFGFMGMWVDPHTQKRYRVWAFAIVLSYSRHMFVQLVLRLDSATWLACHVNAFAFFGAVPQRLLLDNLRDGVVKADLYDPQYNRAYEELAAHYGILPDPCRVGHPKDKPRVERVIPYIRESLWRGTSFTSVADMNEAAKRWCMEIAGRRIHGTTRQRPVELFQTVEAPTMRPLPPQPWELVIWTTAKVAPDAHCAVDRVLYSVPWRYLGEQLSVRLGEKTVQFYLGDELVKTHLRRYGRGRQTDLTDLPSDRIAFFQRTPRWCREKAVSLGRFVEEAVGEVLAVNTLVRLRQAQGILRLADTYGAPRVNAACQRALFYGDPSYRTVKNILQNGLDGQVQCELAGAGANVGAFLRGPAAYMPGAVPAEEA